MDTNELIPALLIMVAVGCGLMVMVPYFTGEVKAEQRWDAMTTSTGKRGPDKGVKDADARRKQVADSLKELDNKRGKRLSLDAKLTQAGLGWSKANYYMFQAIMGVVFTGIVYLVSGNFWLLPFAFAIGVFGLPAWFLSYSKKKRTKKFMEAFPNAIDVIVRGIKAGLPLGDCLRIIASEASEPVKSEFRMIVESQTVGLSVSEAIDRMVERVPVSEASFFAIVIAIQQKAGGNLAEALANLSRVLRERKKLKQKVAAMSSEATASAGIIGSLPVLVTSLVYLTTPSYISLLFTHPTGHLALAISGFWMFIGIMVMKKMINFDV